ncbi:hypothetical protein HDU96_010309 [Phlyctochytrium bullatum]|nr:hypothetical protein HDU96_010309 [Phlyctochytrium bullatum]
MPSQQFLGGEDITPRPPIINDQKKRKWAQGAEGGGGGVCLGVCDRPGLKVLVLAEGENCKDKLWAEVCNTLPAPAIDAWKSSFNGAHPHPTELINDRTRKAKIPKKAPSESNPGEVDERRLINLSSIIIRPHPPTTPRLKKSPASPSIKPFGPPSI